MKNVNHLLRFTGVLISCLLFPAGNSANADPITHEQWRSLPVEMIPIEEIEVSNGDLDANLIQSGGLINISAARSTYGYTGTGYTVVVIDTGLDYNHTSFGARYLGGYDFVNNDSDPIDDNGHGTHVGGIMVSDDGTYTGIAPGANIIALKVLAASGSGDFGAVEAALQWVITNRATYNIVAVNLSLGAGNYTSNPYTFLDDEIATLNSANVVLVAAAGNSFFSYSSAQGLGYPAIASGMFSVGAVYDANVGGYSYSSGAQDYATAADRFASFSQRSAALDVVAPGAPVTAPYMGGGFASLTGTSMAAPIVAAAALITRQALDDIGRSDLATASRIQQFLVENAVDIVDGDDENDNVTNSGLTYKRIDMLATLDDVASYEQTPTPTPTATPTPTPTATPTPTPTATPTATATATPTATPEPEPTATAEPTPTPVPPIDDRNDLDDRNDNTRDIARDAKPRDGLSDEHRQALEQIRAILDDAINSGNFGGVLQSRMRALSRAITRFLNISSRFEVRPTRRVKRRYRQRRRIVIRQTRKTRRRIARQRYRQLQRNR